MDNTPFLISFSTSLCVLYILISLFLIITLVDGG
jgi:hypothetical protein